MKTMIATLVAGLCLAALAADDAAIAARGATSLRPQATSLQADAVTIPQMLSYQGKLTDTLGQPVPDGNYQLTFRLYTQPSGGSAIWTEGQTIQVVDGLFSALLGSVTPISSVPDAGALYLSLQVAVNAELAPRLRIASAAYAFLTARAADADLLQGKDTTALDARYVNEGQANSVTGAMLVDGTVVTADIGDTAVTMAKFARAGATTGQVVKWTGSAWAPGPDNTGGGSGVTNVYQDTGIVCVPNPITTTGNVKLDRSYGDGRYVNEAQANSVTGAMITDGQVSSADIRDTTITTGKLKDAAVTAPKLNQMGATTNQVLKWTGSAWAPRADSGGGPIRGGDIVKPCTLAANVAAMGGVLHLSNTGNGFAVRVDTSGGHGVFVSKAQGSGFYTSRTTNGLGVYRALSNGVDVDSAGASGVYVARAGSNGFRVRRSAFRGLQVDTADNDGINISRTGASGAFMGITATRGVWVDSSGSDGLYVGRSGANGLFVDRAHSYGVRVDTAGTAGVYVDRLAGDGLEVHHAGHAGLEVDSSHAFGVLVRTADSVGVRATSQATGVLGEGVIGGRFLSTTANGSGLAAYSYQDSASRVAIWAWGKAYSTGGWLDWFADGGEAAGAVSDERVMIASGSSRLKGGRADISLPALFEKHVRQDTPLRLSVTPTADAPGLLVAERRGNGAFSVRLRRIATLDGSEDAAFDWIAIGVLQEPSNEPVPVHER